MNFWLVCFLIFAEFYIVFVSYFSSITQSPFLRFFLILYSRFLKFFPILVSKNSMLFHIFPDTVADNGWKNHMSSNFVFSELKNGGSKAGVPVETPKGSRWGVPLLETPHFSTRKDKIMRIWFFSTIFRNVTGKNVKHNTFFNF